MENVVSQIHHLLIKNKKTLAIAESCTGGLTSNFFTQISGSSSYFILGIVAYSNKVKINILKIPSNLILKKGAVSHEVAEEMAQSVRKLAKTDFGIGITGIAGPSGGTIQKPAGTVFIAIDSKHKRICKKFNFKVTRNSIRQDSGLKVCYLLKNMLLSLE